MTPKTRHCVPAGLLLAALALLSGCANDDFLRIDGVSAGAGDTVAANTVMQMVDPWPRGVEETDLAVPAERWYARGVAGGGVAAPATTNP
ncbi:hypothetical protein GN330_17140 [Nitratireductor sp. CAU 1489]|uniref:Uncharacterized protein n=1 Tax=Nitratireductor arenosus TaxID=2682096 RepID=A0A844QI57_9HYPH|nr:hypothetical protein [Nitratireductor arenosus]MVA98975.1 hypothetical protein [Nitratireductor arenosus]